MGNCLLASTSSIFFFPPSPALPPQVGKGEKNKGREMLGGNCLLASTSSIFFFPLSPALPPQVGKGEKNQGTENVMGAIAYSLPPLGGKGWGWG